MHIEHLHRGDWIAIVDEIVDDEPEPQVPAGPFGFMMPSQVPTETRFMGTPAKVLAISAPFILIETIDGLVDTLDFRDYEITKLAPQYVKEWRRVLKSRKPRSQRHHPHGEPISLQDWCGEPEEKETGPQKGLCPYCSTKLKQRLHEKTRPGEWLDVCDQCGFVGGRRQPPEEDGKPHGH